MQYNPYNELKSIYDAKVAWGNAADDEERQRQNQIASAARQKLIDNNYGYLADQVSANGADANAVKKILDGWAKQTDTTTGNYKTGVDNPAYNQEITSASNKNDKRDELILSDHANVNGMYKDLYSYANQDLTQTDEYKSAFANVMPSYNLAAMQGRDNEVASGGANNGGNIDSFAAANATRQQAALTAKGQALAHQMGLDAVNSRVGNAQNILSNLGVYNSGVYSALNEGVNNSRGIANDIFNNSETAKNNQVSRDIAVSEAAGELTSGLLYQLPEYSQFFNTDGTLKNPDIDYTTEIEKAKAAGNTRLEEVLKVARGTKIWNDYAQWGQYDDGNYTLPGARKTASVNLEEQKIKSAEKIANANNETSIELQNMQNQNNIDQIKESNKYKTPEITGADAVVYKAELWDFLQSPFADLGGTTAFKGDTYLGWTRGNATWYRAAHKLRDDKTRNGMIQGLKDNGYTDPKQLEAIMVDWAKRVTENIAAMENKDKKSVFDANFKGFPYSVTFDE